MYNDDGMVVEKKAPSPQPFVQREVAVLMRNGASAPIIQSQDDETPLRPSQMGDAV